MLPAWLESTWINIISWYVHHATGTFGQSRLCICRGGRAHGVRRPGWHAYPSDAWPQCYGGIGGRSSRSGSGEHSKWISWRLRCWRIAINQQKWSNVCWERDTIASGEHEKSFLPQPIASKSLKITDFLSQGNAGLIFERNSLLCSSKHSIQICRVQWNCLYGLDDSFFRIQQFKRNQGLESAISWWSRET